ncbi:MAG: hypothetical protein AB1521_03830 [Bacteroidota bacterium]
MKKLLFLVSLLCLLCTSFSYAQSYSINTSYQLGRDGEYYGVSASKWIKTWNNEKVILRGTARFVVGTHWGEKSDVNEFRRVELGIESRNTMVTGKDFFNIINVSYLFTSYNRQEENSLVGVKENGWMFSFGFGTRLMSPALVTARYVWGPQRGIRLGIELDF